MGRRRLDLVACVSWYTSHPHLLDRLLTSLIGRVAGCVLIDGPYRDLSDEPKSPQDNYDVFPRYEPLIDLRILEGVVYPSEAHKRTQAARMARRFYPDATRLLVIDNDEALISDVPAGCPLRARLHQEGLFTASMVRIYPLTSTILWGPNHGYVEDEGRVYWDQSFDTFPGAGGSFDILHTPADKRIQAEYDRYNGLFRPAIEGDGKRGWPRVSTR